MATLGPMGMIFVPIIDGVSHSPRELSRGNEIAQGTDVLLSTIVKLDARDSLVQGASAVGGSPIVPAQRRRLLAFGNIPDIAASVVSTCPGGSP